jgi:hypothetical protein
LALILGTGIVEKSDECDLNSGSKMSHCQAVAAMMDIPGG